ncbi:BZ3500_MvSof-1268-A1-R1_Chr1-2g01406 [Microbotryum saponariae]|uniref:BZ3500_MvSof-1268-A1-R1_Chr1-2g01406 protein n=1 Tax=Microbotryum saponariae TaxID=289078 RepID=A0A2X0MIH7_9BASI|nr:BZ3500_MvSof-1268-A1-R1_Chr1-2g01406 [Microbotryum saponariae]SCZ97340.1 BZ3501_MvSof-1269-A2-R1_Chr1-2g01005 [Microbotryum saponariae]
MLQPQNEVKREETCAPLQSQQSELNPSQPLNSIITVAKAGASSIVDASRRASSRIDVGLLPHLAPGPDAEVTTDFRQWNIVSRRGKISEKKELTDAGYRYALDDQNQLDVPCHYHSATIPQTYWTSNQTQGPGCGREGQA